MSWPRSLPTVLALCSSPPESVTVQRLAPSTTCAFVTTSPRASKTTPEPRPGPHWTCTTSGETASTTRTSCSCIAVAEAGARTAAALVGVEPLSPHPPRANRAATARAALAKAAGFPIARMLDQRSPAVVSLRTALWHAAPGVHKARGYAVGGSAKSHRRPDDRNTWWRQHSDRACTRGRGRGQACEPHPERAA
jgi:hypothetical protein